VFRDLRTLHLLRIGRRNRRLRLHMTVDEGFGSYRRRISSNGRTAEVQMQPFRRVEVRIDSVLPVAFQRAPFFGVKARGGKYCCCIASVVFVAIAFGMPFNALSFSG